MKYASKRGPVRKDNDCPEMTEAIDWFRDKGYRPYRVSDHQLKWRSLSYYPAKGTVRPDDGSSLKAKGLNALESAMAELLGEAALPMAMEPWPLDSRR